MPDRDIHMDSDDFADKSGRSRVGESFNLALKRNKVAARALRTMKYDQRTDVAVSRNEIIVNRENRIAALNIDLGLLYAAYRIAESSSMSKGKVLPGQVSDWRSNPMYYSKALKFVMHTYHKMKKKDVIISSVHTLPKYLEHIAKNAYKMF